MGTENSKLKKNIQAVHATDIVRPPSNLQYGPSSTQNNINSAPPPLKQPQVVIIHKNQNPEFRPIPPPRNITNTTTYDDLPSIPPSINPFTQPNIKAAKPIPSYNASVSETNIPYVLTPVQSAPNVYTQQSSADNTNSYEWTMEMIDALERRTMKEKYIDFDAELPKIKSAIKSSTDDDYKHLNKELTKNKPLADVRKSLVNNKYLSDVKFYIKDKVIYGHKIFLITASSLFHKTFEVDLNTTMFLDESIDADVFMTILSYCYTGQLKVTTENVLEILSVASALEVRQVSNICHGFISSKINCETVFDIFEKAIALESEVFQKKCMDYISKNEAKCFSSKGFFAIKLPSLIVILEKCKFTSEKSNEVHEKWHQGAIMVAPTEPVNVNVNPTGVKKKVNQPKNKQPAKGDGGNQPTGKGKKQKNQQNVNKPPAAANKQNINRPPQQQPQNMNKPPPPQFMQQQQQKKFNQNPIQNLLDMNILPPPLMNYFNGYGNGINPVRPFANQPNFMPQNVNNHDIICVDDENQPDNNSQSKTVTVNGAQQMKTTEFARFDFIVRRSVNLKSIYFTGNLFAGANDIKVTVSVMEQDKRSEIHSRSIKNDKPGKKLDFVNFNRPPLKLYVGQKCCIKLNFSQKAALIHLNPDNISSPDILVVDAAKKYFNCIKKLVVSEMT